LDQPAGAKALDKAFTDNLSLILKKDTMSTNPKSYYLPFRYISSIFKFVSSYYDYSTIQGWVTTDERKTFLFRFKLTWKATGYYITNDQAIKVIQKINQMRSTRQTEIEFKNSKLELLAGILEYLINRII
jgi:hypothetical protein